MPLDSDGFLRRECPHCLKQFKWHHGPANAEAESYPDPPAYSCPLCGRPAGPDSWWTQQQLDYAQGVATPAALRHVQDELDRAFSGHNNKHVRFKTSRTASLPDEPMPLTEPDDMVIIASPCHPYEPVKVPEEGAGPFHCLICGERFAL